MAPWVEAAGETDVDSNLALATERSDARQKALAAAGTWRAALEGVELPPISIARPPVAVEIPESHRKPKIFGFTDADTES